uniref:MATH domain-containing protein n=2 Tax=Panagrellus redivivus TaxID=6233 RepID=A0A7E4VRH0_PANRE
MESFTEELAESRPRFGRCLNIFPSQKDIIDPQTTSFNRKKSFTFTIKGLERFVDGFVLYSPPFGVGGLMWRILVKVVSVDCDGKLKRHLGFFTSCCSHPYSSNWKATVKATLITITSMNTIFQRRQTEHEYSAKNYDWGYSQFGALEDIKKNCFHDDEFKVRMDIEIIRVEMAQTLHRFMNNLITRVDAPMKRLREGYVDEAIQLNNDVLREAMGRSAWVIEKVKWQGQMLNKMKLKQSIKRIEKGGTFSPTNDRITVKTALMGVPLPKHLSKQLNLLPKSVRVDVTATKVAAPSVQKNSGDSAPVCTGAEGCTCETCIEDGIKTLKSSLSKTSVGKSEVETVKNVEGQSEPPEDPAYYTPNNSTSESSLSSDSGDSTYVNTDISESSDPEPTPEDSSPAPNLLPIPASMTEDELFPTQFSRKVVSEAATLAKIKYPDLGCDAEELLGKMPDGKTGMAGCRDVILQTYFTKILQDEEELPFETFCENLKMEAIKNFEKILITVLDFFRHVMNHIAKISTVTPPEFTYDQPSYEVGIDCLEWIDKCTDLLADFIEVQSNDMESRRINQILEFRKQQHAITDSVKDRHIAMLKIRDEAIRLQIQLKELLIEVEKHEVLNRRFCQSQSDVRKKTDELMAICEKREADRVAVMDMIESIDKNKALFEDVLDELKPFRREFHRFRTGFNEAAAVIEEGMETTAKIVNHKVRALNEVRKQADKMQREREEIVKSRKTVEEKHAKEMRSLDRHKLIDLCGMVQDEVEEFLDHCDDAIQRRRQFIRASQSESERCAFRAEIEILYGLRSNGKAALTTITKHTNECLRLFDCGSNIEDLPKVPVIELPEIPFF